MHSPYVTRRGCIGAALAVACFGSTACGDGPVEPPGDTAPSFVRVTAGAAHSCALDSAGAIHCWGRDDEGQLGLGPTDGADVREPMRIESDIEFVAVAAGDAHTCALDVEGVAYCWGRNDRGQIGDSTTMARDTPARVAGGHTFTAIAVGANHACGILTPKLARCWGDNSFGQLGDATTEHRAFPVGVELTEKGDQVLDLARIAAGGGHTCALEVNGLIHCWGNNGTGQLGNGIGASSDVPLPAVGTSDFEAVTAGGVHTCAWATGATLGGCWGFNLFGQLGDGTNQDEASPGSGSLAGDPGLRFLSAGSDHTCGLTSDGAAFCWGFNGDGRLGDGGRTDRNQPTPVSGDLMFKDISAGGVHTCGVTTAGDVYCWGANADGQLGDGTTSERVVPVHAGG